MISLFQNKCLGLLVIWDQCWRTAVNKSLSAVHSKIYIRFLRDIVQLMTVPLEKPFRCVCDGQHAVVDLSHACLSELRTQAPVLLCGKWGVQFLDVYNCSVSIICSYNGSVYEERSALWSYWYESNWLVMWSGCCTLGVLICIDVVVGVCVCAQCVFLFVLMWAFALSTCLHPELNNWHMPKTSAMLL